MVCPAAAEEVVMKQSCWEAAQGDAGETPLGDASWKQAKASSV